MDSLLVYLIVGVLCMALAVPLMRRRVGPNSFYGLRVPATMADEEVWYEANAHTGRDLFAYGSVVAGLGLLLPFAGFDERLREIAMFVVIIGGALVMVVVGWIRASRMLKARKSGDWPTSESDSAS